MGNTTLLMLLKSDLQLLTSANDLILAELIEFAKTQITREGITLKDDTECNMIIIHYAAHLFRKRAGQDTSMPRFLRYELNNLLFSQKGDIDANV